MYVVGRQSGKQALTSGQSTRSERRQWVRYDGTGNRAYKGYRAVVAGYGRGRVVCVALCAVCGGSDEGDDLVDQAARSGVLRRSRRGGLCGLFDLGDDLDAVCVDFYFLVFLLGVALLNKR